MNILILSAGTRNKIIQYFKRALDGRGCVFATDMSPFAPAVYEADKYFIVPRITDSGYLDKILEICSNNNVKGVLSLIDPELSLIAKHQKRFEDAGVSIIGSDYERCELAFDKISMFRWLEAHGYFCAKSYVDFHLFMEDYKAGIIDFPVFVKPVFGSASIAINKADDLETLQFLLKHHSDLLIQQYLKGQEIGADVYIDMISGEVVSVFTKKKLLMRAGETDKAISFKDEKLFSLITRFAEECGFRGQIDIDIFEIDGRYYISEVNPRFGGGYPHAYECGIDHMRMIINNLNGITNQRNIGHYDEGVVMMKYNEIGIIRT